MYVRMIIFFKINHFAHVKTYLISLKFWICKGRKNSWNLFDMFLNQILNDSGRSSNILHSVQVCKSANTQYDILRQFYIVSTLIWCEDRLHGCDQLASHWFLIQNQNHWTYLIADAKYAIYSRVWSMKGVATLCVFLWVTFEFIIHGGEYKANTRRTQGEYASFSSHPPSHYPRDKYFSCAKIMHHILAFYFQQQWYIWAQWARIWYANVCLNSSRICFSYPFSVSSFLSVNFTNPAWYSLSSLLGGFAHSFVGILFEFLPRTSTITATMSVSGFARCRPHLFCDVGLRFCFFSTPNVHVNFLLTRYFNF